MNFSEALNQICGRCKRQKGTCKTCPVFTIVEEHDSEEYVEHQLALIRSIKYSRGGNWYLGVIGGYLFQVKVAEEDSPFGLNEGRIIKLFVKAKPSEDQPGDKTVIAFERGWSCYPKDDHELLNVLDALYEYFQNHIDEEV